MSLSGKALTEYYVNRINTALKARSNLEFNIVLTQWLMHRKTDERNVLLDQSYVAMRVFSRAMEGKHILSQYEVENILKVLGYKLEVISNGH